MEQSPNDSRERRRYEMHDNHTGLLVFSAIGHFMIELSLTNEPDKQTREEKRHLLHHRWTAYTNEVAERTAL